MCSNFTPSDDATQQAVTQCAVFNAAACHCDVVFAFSRRAKRHGATGIRILKLRIIYERGVADMLAIVRTPLLHTSLLGRLQGPSQGNKQGFVYCRGLAQFQLAGQA